MTQQSTALIELKQPIVVGRVGKPYGVQGWVNIHSFTDPVMNIQDYQPWYLHRTKGYQTLSAINIKPHGKGLVAQLDQCNDRTLAQQYTNLDIVIEREQLPTLAEGEYYLEDLLDMAVFTEDGQALGTVDYVMPTGAHDVLVLAGDKQRLIPLVHEKFVKKVDLQQQQIIVDWDPEF